MAAWRVMRACSELGLRGQRSVGPESSEFRGPLGNPEREAEPESDVCVSARIHSSFLHLLSFICSFTVMPLFIHSLSFIPSFIVIHLFIHCHSFAGLLVQ